MPWETILGALGGSSIAVVVTVVLALIFMQRVIEKTVDTSAKRFESSIQMAEEAYKNRLALESQIDIHLREKRIAVYEKLWRETSLLPKWPKAEGLSYQDLFKFSETLRDWYFQEGGMYLSEAAREVYGTVQDEIEALLQEKPSGNLDPDHYETVRRRCSALRRELTGDILSRRAPLL